MDPKKKMMKKKKEKAKVSKSQSVTCPSFSKKDLVITSPSHSNMDLQEAMKKQSDVAMFLTGKVISAVARNSNFVFSPASIYAVLTMVAASIEEETLRSVANLGFNLTGVKISSQIKAYDGL
ncbi:unnamed protein product [Microthlaspi erraticum]|uniref:Serpin domain-containing protein n=1 Tax=Microthlaspi erraticum TaxID=1685480 RepID=A0A6D2IGX7_9BRAS|nr:unnamed protein product [Microthlaspi erraticum]